MTNEELKEKIVEVVLNSEITGIQIRAITGGVSTANSIADALIAAGLRFGENLTATFDHMALEREHDLERRLAEAEHRAKVAEKAFDLINKENPSCFVPYSCHGLDCIECAKKYFYEQAEKELAEERQ